jgi:hypothetical protein
MKTLSPAYLSLIATFAALSVYAQGTFQDLDFEQANPIPAGNNGSYVTATSALPGWMAYIGGVPQTQVGWNTFALDLPIVDLIGPPELNGCPYRRKL